MTKEQLKKLENDLWDSANAMRAYGGIKAADYAVPVLGLIFLRFAENKYSHFEKDIVKSFEKDKGTRMERTIQEVALSKCGFYLPDNARYDYLLNLSGDKSHAKALKEAMEGIEEYQDEAIERAKEQIDELLDSSILGQGDLLDPQDSFTIEDAKQVDLSKLNFDKLREEFPEKEHKNIEFADLREFMDIKLKQMVAQNKTRGSFLARFQDVIDNYNSGSISIEEAYEELIKQAEDLSEEESRAAKNGMSEEEQELFDLLKKEKLSQKEEKGVKLAAHTLLEKVMDSKNRIFLPEWHKEKASQEKVKHEIQKILNETLPDSYDRDIFTRKTDAIFQHFFELAVSGRMAS